MTYTPNKITGLDRVRDMMDKTNAIMDALSELQLIPGAGVVVDENHIFSVAQSTDAQTLGGLEPTRFVQVVLSETAPIIGLYEGLEWLKPSTGEIKAYVGGEFKSVGGGVLTMYHNHVILNSNSSTVTIGIPSYMRDRDSIIVAKNGQPMYNGIDFSVSADSLNLEIIIHSKNPGWYANDDFYIWVLGTADVSSDILATTVLISSYTALTSGITNVPINNVNYNPTNDILQVSMSGITLDEVDHYTKNLNGISIDLVDWSLNSGDKIVFRVQKKVRTDITTLDGATISGNSINNGALGTDIKIGSLSLLPTVNKTDVVSAITEVAGSVDTKISALVNSSPATLDTLKELADALGDDPNYATTTAELIGSKTSQVDFDSHQAEDATQAERGHMSVIDKTKLDGIATNANNYVHPTTDGNKHIPAGGAVNQVVGYGGTAGTGAWVPAPTPVDYGRYQAEFGFDGTESYNNLSLAGTSVNLDLPGITTTLTPPSSAYGTYTAKYGVKIHVNTSFTTISIVLNAACTATKLYVLNTSRAVLASANLSGVSGSIDYNFVAGTDYYIDVDNNGANYAISNAVVTYPINGVMLNVTASDSGGTNDVNNFNFNSISASTKSLNGTVTKTITPSDLKKWGNAKWDQSTPANTSVVCDVLSNNVYSAQKPGSAGVYANSSWSQKIIANTSVENPLIQLKYSDYLYGTVAQPLVIGIYTKHATLDKPDIKLGEISVPSSTFTSSAVDFFVDIAITGSIISGNEYFIVFSSAASNSTNCHQVGFQYGITGGNCYTFNGTTWTKDTTKNIYGSISLPLKSNVISIADLSDIDAIAYPSLKIRGTLSRLSVSDASPTVSDPSWTWEGAEKVAVQIADGTWSDTTTSITTGSTYTKTIPLGFKASIGSLIAQGYDAENDGVIAYFTTDPNNAHGIGSKGTDSFSKQKALGSSGAISKGIFGAGDYITLKDAYILESDLILKFYSVSTTSLTVRSLVWKVEG